MLDYQFKVTGMVGGQSRKADIALAFATQQALTRFAAAAHSVVRHDGSPYWDESLKITTYGRLMQIPAEAERFRALPGLNIEYEARCQAHRLLREDIDAAWGGEYTVQRHQYRVRGGAIHPRQPINTQPRGFARLDEAFEATFNV